MGCGGDDEAILAIYQEIIASFNSANNKEDVDDYIKCLDNILMFNYN